MTESLFPDFSYVSEHSSYHHGEQSLCATIVNMAQVGKSCAHCTDRHARSPSTAPDWT
jgi:hypothetical protein